MGSAALGLAYAACGRFDVYVHQYLYPWDTAAGILFVQEAGGLVIEPDGGAADRFTASAWSPARLDRCGTSCGSRAREGVGG